MPSRSAWGAEYRDEGLVVCREDGHPLHPRDLHRKIRLHDLRHTHATLALRAGVHPKVVQERLGHGTISITLDVYSHAIPAMQEEAADRVAALVGQGLTVEDG